MNEKLDFDATKLFEALKYQIHVAIDYCHTLAKEDVLWIEVFGDVTVEGRVQVEVKDYDDDLSDSHVNFWNTLNNWLKPEFDHRKYANLVLLTTQAYGERASLKNWEESDASERLSILYAIHEAGLKRFERARKKEVKATAGEADAATVEAEKVDTGGGTKVKAKPKSASPSESLKLQNKVMAPDVRLSLINALPKIKIITEQPGLLELISKYKISKLKAIMEQRQDLFIDDLFGFMTNAGKITGGWQITGAEFDKKFTELTVRHINGTLKFPRIDSNAMELDASTLNVRNRSYAKKLEEIGGDEEVIRQATVDLLHAEQYIAELIRDVTTSQTDIADYSNNHLKMHLAKRASAMYKCASMQTIADLKGESCAFYFERCGEHVEKFSTYDFTPVEFRNGIYHMLADQDQAIPQKKFHWRLWK